MVDISVDFGLYGEDSDGIRRTRRYRKRYEVKPRVLAVRALRSLGFGDVCVNEPHDWINQGRMVSGGLWVSAVLGLGVLAVAELGFSVLAAAGAVLAVVFAPLVLLMLNVITPRTNRYIVVCAWWVTLGWLLFTNSALIMLTHLLPLALAVLGRWVLRAGLLARRMPLFLPAALVIVLAPMFTEDPWKFVASAGWRLAALAVLAVGPLLFLVLRRLRNVRLEQVMEQAGSAVSGDVDKSVRMGATMLRNRCIAREHWPRPKELNRFLKLAHQKPDVGRLCELAAREFPRRVRGRLISLLIGTSAATYAVIYLLTVVAMPSSLAEAWSGTPTTYVDLDVVWRGLDVMLPVWPYAGVASLFSIIAAAGLLAAALTDDVYTNAVVDVVYGHLARLLIVVGVPFLADIPDRK
ncbi:hypothetical protein C8D87_103807 [Lentzea atacamensis]|uniref:Uncharacterized protein n=1 Tax=Lentzea atacamensis TaxID=531938 RepID=A0ABX9EEY2_9PSEU|nr:hypothetical protein [Lentzea atacamensis]RAS67468.1 hypothetical protein C8D87_103807 [Lentzea atacamensis]